MVAVLRGSHVRDGREVVISGGRTMHYHGPLVVVKVTVKHIPEQRDGREA